MVADKQIYIVDFYDVFDKFRRVLSDPELPTIDDCVVKHEVLSIFMQVDPLAHLERIAKEMVKEDFLYTKSDFLYETHDSFATTPEQAAESDRFLREYMREAIIDLGRAMYNKFIELGLFHSGYERYQVINRPYTDDTYLFQRFRPIVAGIPPLLRA